MADRPPPSTPSTGLRGAARLVRAREHVLAAAAAERVDGVRAPILESWQRSQRWDVPVDRVRHRYLANPDLDTPLALSAAPVLHQLRDQLVDEPVSVILTDTAGVVLSRWTGDSELERRLDRVHLAPGFTYAEQVVGTNGIGTALQSGRPTAVFGHEHYAEHLEDFACAGVPITHPVSRQPVGLLDLTCWNADAGPLLLALATTTAERIEKALRDASGQRELALVREFTAACRRAAGMVLAANNDVVMMNAAARTTLSADDQALLVARSSEAVTAGRPLVLLAVLGSGATARLHCTPVWGDTGLAGCVLDVAIDEVPAPRSGAGPGRPRTALPGLAGSAPAWVRACQQVAALRAGREAVVVEGEPGVGKLAVVRAAHLAADAGAHLRVLDADGCRRDRGCLDELADELAEGGGTVVLRHLDRLPADLVEPVAAVLRDAAARWAAAADRPWVVATLSSLEHADPGLGAVLAAFPSSVTVPPLRARTEDVPELVRVLLPRLRADGVALSPEAVRVLLRARWPGNTAQLVRVLTRTVRHRRTGVVHPEDLPPEVHAHGRRVLTPLESLERDAIVTSLLDAEGNKTRAAENLGLSRATIYRKIREFGIDVGPPG